MKPALAIAAGPLRDGACFERLYETAHLAAHPTQSVTAVSLSFRDGWALIRLLRRGQGEPVYVTAGCDWNRVAGRNIEDKITMPGFRGGAGYDCIAVKDRSSAEEGGSILLAPERDVSSLVLHLDGRLASRRGLSPKSGTEEARFGEEDRTFRLASTAAKSCRAFDGALRRLVQ